VYGGLAVTSLPMTLGLLYFTQFKPYAEGSIGDARIYGVALPVMLAAGICMVLGVLALVVRKPWTVKGCAVGMASVASVYFGAMIAVEGVFPTDPLSLCFVLLAFLAVPGYRQAIQRSKVAKPLEIPSEITKVGNISYTGWGLLMLFAWLLWFDFCFSMMEGVLGSVLSFRLINELNTPNIWLGIMMGSIPTLVGFFLTPVISVKSDRHRGPRGRRIPFLLWASPFVCALLALIGFANDIGAWLHAGVVPHLAAALPQSMAGAKLALASASQDTIIIWTFFILNFVFFIANSFMGTVFYYLFNDVVPPGHFVKFMAYMRVVGGVAGITYAALVFQYSNKSGPLDINLGFWSYSAPNVWYPKLILCGAAIFYMAAGMITFFKIKEPDYPPPPPMKVQGHNWSEVWQVLSKTRAGPIAQWVAKPMPSHFVAVPVLCVLLLAAAQLTCGIMTMNMFVLVIISLMLESLFLVLLLVPVFGWLRRPARGMIASPAGILVLAPAAATLFWALFWASLPKEPALPRVLAMAVLALALILTLGLLCAWLRGRAAAFRKALAWASGRGAKLAAQVFTFGSECFSHRFYALIFLWMTLDGLAMVTSQWKNPLRISVGITTDTLGQLTAATGAVGMVLTILTANYGDRFRPLPLMVVAAALIVLTAPIGLLWLIPGLPPNWYLGVEIVYDLTHLPIGIVAGIAGGPLLMTLFPRDRYGQFSAGAAVIRNTLCGVFAAAFVGWLMDRLKALHGGGDYYLRYAFAWQILFQVAILVVLYLMYREWKKLGGKNGFKPPPVGPI
jgi:hypothetical protein